MTEVIRTGYEPHRWQAEIHNSLKRFSVLVCHRRFGKTVLAVNALIDAALRCDKQDGRFGYIAPYLKQAKDIAWMYVKRYGAHIPETVINETELSVTFGNGARVRLYGSDNDEAMRGLYFDGIVGDEVADWRPQTWTEIVRPALSDRKGWALFIGTPKGVNQFFSLYQQALSDPDWYAGIYRADETGVVDQEELLSAQKTMSDAQYRQEYLCDFAAAADNVLIQIDDVIAATKKRHGANDLIHAPLVLGVDVARFGDDRSVIIRRKGLQAFDPVVYQDIDNMQLAAAVANMIRDDKPDAVFVDAGRGEGVIDRLRQLGHHVMEVNFGGKSTSHRYANKRAEMWGEMAEWVRMGGALPDNKSLVQDLVTPTYRFDAANRMQLESKDEMKKRGCRSPDIADALALTFAAPVAKRSEYAGSSLNKRREYDSIR